MGSKIHIRQQLPGQGPAGHYDPFSGEGIPQGVASVDQGAYGCPVAVGFQTQG